MSTTVIPTVASQLKILLKAELDKLKYEGVPPEIFDAFPASITGWDYCVIGDILEGRHEYPVMKAGRKKREESYIQRLEFLSTRPGGESTEARTSCLLMFNEVEDMLADDPAIGLSATHPTLRLEVREFGLNTTHDSTNMGWRVSITADVLVQVRLS